MEKAYFSHRYKDYWTLLVITIKGKRVMESSYSNRLTSTDIVFKYKSRAEAWDKYLYRLGVCLRGTWEFEGFSWQKNVEANMQNWLKEALP